jgi:hypothetical protein
VIKSRRIRWAGYVALMVPERMAYRILWKSQKERYHYEDQDIGGRIM